MATLVCNGKGEIRQTFPQSNLHLHNTTQKHMAFWEEVLSDIPTAYTALPFTKPCQISSTETLRRRVSRCALQATEVEALKRQCNEFKATPFHFLLAAVRGFMFRYTEDDDMVLLAFDGSRTSTSGPVDKPSPVALVPIRCKGDCEGTFLQLLDSIKLVTEKAYSHGDVSFDFLAKKLQGGKGNRCPSLGRIAVAYEVSEFGRRRRQTYPLPELDFQINADPDSGSWDVHLEFSPTLYEEDEMSRFLENFSTFLSAIVQNSPTLVSEIKMCGSSEEMRLRKLFWNMQISGDPWEETDICQLIIQHALEQPQALAVQVSNGDAMSYSQLVDRAQQLAAVLQKAGLEEGQNVCLMLKPGVEAIIAMLGVVLCRCCYVALDAEFSPKRLSFIVSDCGAKVIIYQSELRHLTDAVVGESTVNPSPVEILASSTSEQTMRVVRSARNDDPFYIVYTSGSTGKPKGVVLSHGNTRQMLSSMNRYFGFTSRDRFLQQSSLSFDLSIVQIFSALTAGGQVCIARPDVRKDPVELVDFMRHSSVTVVYFTPTHFALLLEHARDALRQSIALRIAMFAGERLSPEVVKAFYDVPLHAQVYNTWSPSELVVQTTLHKVDYPEATVTNIPIGTPLPNCHHYIVDPAMNPLPVGIVGEICVGGAQVGLGYLNNPEINVKSFPADPFCSKEEAQRGWTRLFRTGDRGRFLPSGVLEFHGRIAGDKQIKLRGFRIDLGEVEQKLLQVPKNDNGQKIVNVAVVARSISDDSSANSSSSLADDRRIIAFVVVRHPFENSSDLVEYTTIIHKNIQSHLNAYMLPNGYQFLDALPTTVGGKVERQALLSMNLHLNYPSTTVERSETVHAGAEVDSGISDAVISLMKKVINNGRPIAPTDNFFDVGGQSILLLRLKSRLKKHFGVTLQLHDIFQTPTPAGITRLISDANKTHTTTNGTAAGGMITWADEYSMLDEPHHANFGHLTPIQRSEVNSILFTGVETYIGIHLLAHLLSSRPDIKIYILGTLSEARSEALIDDMEKYKLLNGGLMQDQVCSQVICVAGTMAASDFGLSTAVFQDLANSVEAIYNIAAEVSLLKTYSDLKPVNADAVRTLVKLASHRADGRAPEIHHLSTWSIPHLQTWPGSSRSSESIIATEQDALHFSPTPTNEQGYLKSRWVGEAILARAARRRGLPVSIYRAAAVSSSLSTGVPSPSLDFVGSLIMNMIRHDVVADIAARERQDGVEFVIDFVPVDVLAKAFVYVSTHDDGVTRVGREPDFFHFGSSQPLRLSALPDLTSLIRGDRSAEKADIISIHEWLAIVMRDASEQEHLYWEVVREYLQNGHIMFALDNTKATTVLASAPEMIEFPAIDVDFLTRLWRQTTF
ncbi:hypothetical protein F5Y09DRAFT_118121 [Xylaria sp. FL1042]|nr:hypothetical protein F5Y09DRAFT_118121 [Xylaria sp. FL1042]